MKIRILRSRDTPLRMSEEEEQDPSYFAEAEREAKEDAEQLRQAQLWLDSLKVRSVYVRVCVRGVLCRVLPTLHRCNPAHKASSKQHTPSATLVQDDDIVDGQVFAPETREAAKQVGDVCVSGRL